MYQRYRFLKRVVCIAINGVLCSHNTESSVFHYTAVEDHCTFHHGLGSTSDEFSGRGAIIATSRSVARLKFKRRQLHRPVHIFSRPVHIFIFFPMTFFRNFSNSDYDIFSFFCNFDDLFLETPAIFFDDLFFSHLLHLSSLTRA